MEESISTYRHGTTHRGSATHRGISSHRDTTTQGDTTTWQRHSSSLCAGVALDTGKSLRTVLPIHTGTPPRTGLRSIHCTAAFILCAATYLLSSLKRTVRLKGLWLKNGVHHRSWNVYLCHLKGIAEGYYWSQSFEVLWTWNKRNRNAIDKGKNIEFDSYVGRLDQPQTTVCLPDKSWRKSCLDWLHTPDRMTRGPCCRSLGGILLCCHALVLIAEDSQRLIKKNIINLLIIRIMIYVLVPVPKEGVFPNKFVIL